MTLLDPSASTDHDRLVAALDLPAKVRLLTGATAFTLAPEPSIGLAELRLSDGPTGVRGLKFVGGRTVALFPNATLLSSAWSEESATEVGRMLAEEALAQQIHVVLGPTINLHRSLLGGRLFEAYSEDPLLTGKLAAAYVRGMQALGVGACLKHLVANESETDRHTVDSVVDEATLRELYLLPFEIATAESDPWSMMAAYNDVNGVAATEQHHVNTEVVKGEWGYTGLIMSDWFATKTAGPAANGGLDLVMPGPNGPWGEALVAAVRAGEVPESVVDDHVRRLLVLADRVGVLGTERDYPTDLPTPTSAVRREQLTQLAAAGMTVLTNHSVDGVPALPLATGPTGPTGPTVALIGRHAVATIGMGGGSAQVNAPYEVSIAEGLRALLGDAVTVTDGVEVRDRPVPAAASFVADPATGEPGTQITLLRADGSVIEERHAATSTSLVGFDDGLAGLVHTLRLRATVADPGGEALLVGTLGAGNWELRVGGEVRSYPVRLTGHGMGEEVLSPPPHAELVPVAWSSSGASPGLSSSGPVTIEAIVTLQGDPDDPHPMAGIGMYGLIARAAPRDADEAIADAVRAAGAADVAVVVVGLTAEQETEAVDKSTLHLPGRQDDLVRAVAAAARRTVVVVNAATPVIMPWLDQVDAVLWAGLPGQEAGHAVAAALLGVQEPAGRLVTTFPVEDAATPAWSVTPVDGKLPYSEGTFIGYRGHAAGRAPAPAFWFGHGLGYATWEYADAAVAPSTSDAEGPRVSVTVTNTGTRTSREVVQVYFRPDDASQPVRLVGWSAVTVDAGASAGVEVATDRRLWRRWDTATSSWSMLPDAGTLVIARGLGDPRATLPLP